MEKWHINKYEKPYLDITSVQLIDNKKLYINSDINDFDIEINDDKTDLNKISHALESLKKPSSPYWDNLKQSKNEDTIYNLINHLDQLALIKDFNNNEHILADELHEIEELINKSCSVVSNSMEKDKIFLLQENILNLLDFSSSLLIGMSIDLGLYNQDYINYKKLDETDNFFINTLFIQMKYLKDAMPLSLLVWFETLVRISEKNKMELLSENINIIRKNWKNLVLHFIGGIFNNQDLLTYQNCLVSNLFDSIKSDSKSKCQPYYNNLTHLESLSGINFMVEIERLAEKILASLPESTLLKNINANSLDKKLIMGLFIEEFHITYRFVEIITPMLSKRLNEHLRSKMFRYFKEEVGHEKLEQKICLSIGLTKKDLYNSCPLPLTQALVDAFTFIANSDPTAFVLSIMLAEGRMGEISPLHDMLDEAMKDNEDYQKVASAHIDINKNMNHTSLSRIFMSTLPLITPAVQKRAIKYFLYLLELNYRLSEQMVEYYTGLSKPYI